MNSQNNHGQLLYPIHPSLVQNALWIASVALVYFAAARLSLSLIFQPQGIAAIWPPDGIFLSAILLTRRSIRPHLIGVLFIMDLIAEMLAGTPLLVSVVYALTLSGEAVLSAWLLLRFVNDPFSFRRVRDVFGFLFLAVFLSNFMSSLVAAAASFIPGTSFWSSWIWWATSDGIGNLLVTPFILSWASSARTGARAWNPRQAGEGAALFISFAVLNYVAFRYLSEQGQFSLWHTYLTLPFLLWAALRFSLRGVTSVLIILATIAVYFNIAGHSINILQYKSTLETVIVLQLSLAVIALPSLFLTMVVTERKQAEDTLRERESLLNKAEEIAHVGSWEHNHITGRLTWSDEVYLIFGLSPRVFGATYQAFLDAVHPEDRAAVDAAYSVSLREGEDTYEIEHRVVQKHTGEIRYVYGKCEHVRDATRRIIRSVGMVHDITERKRAEKAVQELSRKNEEALRVAHMGHWEFDIAVGLFTFNDQYFKLHGTNAEEAGGYQMTAEDFARKYVHPEDAHLVQESIQMAMATDDPGFQFQTEARILRFDGEVRTFFVWFRAEKNQHGSTVKLYGVNQDITEQRNAEKSLRERDRYIENILENAPIGFAVNTIHDGKGVFVGGRFEDIYGVPRGSLHSVEDYFEKVYLDPVFRKEISTRMLADMATGDATRMRWENIPITTAAGEKRFVTANNIPLLDQNLMVSTVQDVTARHRAEAALRESEERFRTLIEQAGDGFALLDTEGRYVDANSTTCRQLGYSKEELHRLTIHDIEPTMSREKYAAAFTSLAGKSSITFETVHRRKDGTTFPVEITTSVIPLGDVPMALTLARDITERTQADQERKNLQAQLLQAQKLESIGQLAGGIAHDFNNILAAIVGYGEILQMKMKPDDPFQAYIKEVLAATDRATGLTQSLLAFSRKQVSNPKEINLNTSIQKVNKFLSRIIGEDINLTMCLQSEPLTIFADVTQIEQVLMNLATNARDAMPNGGSLVISTEQIEYSDAQTVTHSFGEGGSYAVLSVSDTGTGMDEQTKSKIFDPFFTTKEIGRGTGLGLSIVYGVVKQNNGQINVYSEVGKGTTFKIYFPLRAASTIDHRYSDITSSVQGGTETILIAEDDEVIRALSRQVLSELGYTVIEAADGEAALKLFQDNVDKVRLIITDVIMPKKNGRAFCDEAMKFNPSIKVIYTSGYPADLIEKEGVLWKEMNFVSKPASPRTLARKVREVLDRPAV